MTPTVLASIGAPPAPSIPTFISQAPDAGSEIENAIKAIISAKRIVVVCGAGISVAAGIPDFRSTDGLFQTLKRNNPNQSLSSGKDLFDSAVFKSEAMTSLFNEMIANLSDAAGQAAPTAFHRLLKALDDMGKLTRVYTQNIDSLEEKVGLTFGVPSTSPDRRKAKGQLPSPPPDIPASSSHDTSPGRDAIGSSSSSAKDTAISKCIPLHGHVQTMYCTRCFQSVPLSEHVSKLHAGESVPCSSCEDLEATRRLVGKRERGVGSLRPSVVLYGETHREGEAIGECVRRDLLGIRRGRFDLRGSNLRTSVPKTPPTTPSKSRSNLAPDLLIVAGTSLKVPGTKRIVREFAKAVKSSSKADHLTSTHKIQLLTPASSPAPPNKPGLDRTTSSSSQASTPGKPKTILLNLDFPVPSREWENVFDTWIQGDLQSFAKKVEQEFIAHVEKKRRRAEQPSATKSNPRSSKPKQGSSSSRKVISKATINDEDRPRKKQRASSSINTTPTSSVNWQSSLLYPSLPPPIVMIPARKPPSTPSHHTMSSLTTTTPRIRRVSLILNTSTPSTPSHSKAPSRTMTPHPLTNVTSEIDVHQYRRRSPSTDPHPDSPATEMMFYDSEEDGPCSPSLDRMIRRVQHDVLDS